MSDSSRSSSSFLRGALAFDRRADARYQYESCGDALASQGGQEFLPVHILNISVGGLAFLTDRRVERGLLLSIELPSKDEAGSRRLVMCVRTAESQSSGSWKIGCEFARKLTLVELLALL